MGKNGIRVGDWVEINGVSGEVVEIGMLRTVLLETGSLADAGHPTGRRVTFMNSFAIEGKYFNFSTTGQWLWDELRVRVPKGDDAYQRIEAIRERIAESTQQDATVAEQEWRLATKDEALRGFSAAPTIDLRPAADGIDVTVRYITRAQKRYEVRSSLYQDVIRLLQGDPSPQLETKE
jgi:small-conductance mechanosensitive channel